MMCMKGKCGRRNHKGIYELIQQEPHIAIIHIICKFVPECTLPRDYDKNRYALQYETTFQLRFCKCATKETQAFNISAHFKPFNTLTM